MDPEMNIEMIAVEALLNRVQLMRAEGLRLVAVSATRLPDRVELTYSFGHGTRLLNLRLHLSADEPRVPSISSIYQCVLLYENEMHDLFDIQVDGMAVDFQGKLYQTAVKFPFGSTKAPETPANPVPAK